MLRTARRHFSFARILNVGSVLAVSAAAMPVVGADEPDRLEQRATVYLWAAGIDSTTASGDEVSVSFEQLIKNLNMTFMGAYELRKGPWSGGIDLVYLNVGAGGDGTVPVQGPGPLGIRRTFDVTADVKTRGWVIDLYGARRLVQTDRLELDALLGARYLEMRLDFKLGVAGERYQVNHSLTSSDVVWDAVAGVKGKLLLDGPWSMPYRFDIGAGDSDLTWQANAGFAYSWDRAEVALTYRYISWDFSSGSLDNVVFSGPQLSASWRF